MSTVKISCLPENALLTIFDYAVSLDSMDIFLTCSRWASLRGEVYARRRRLYLQIGGENWSHHNYSVDAEWIHCPRLTKTRTNWLVRTLGNVTDLMVMFKDPIPDQGSVIWAQVLLSHWANRLVSLNYWQARFHADSTYPMLARINSLVKLETLQLQLFPSKEDGAPKLDLAQVPFPLLSWLKKKLIFAVVCCPILDFCRWFQQNYERNTGLELEFLEMDEPLGYDRPTMNALYRYEFLAQFSSIGIPASEVADLGGLRKYCRRFAGLDSISLHGYLRLSLAEATQCLTLLPKLTELYFRLCGGVFRLGNRGRRGMDGYTPLPQVRTLGIHFTFGNPCDEMPEPHEFSTLPFSTIFPSLEKLYLWTETVWKCPTPHRHPARGTQEQMFQQKKAYARAFRACPKLVAVCTGEDDEEGAVTWTRDDLFD